MSENNNIRKFTASDIEKYHKGLLSAKEKHALEKAALDDPFLADALEGYTTAGVYIAEDMKELNERLSEKIEKTKVIPKTSTQRSKSSWWRVAAIIILVAGGGFLAYQLGFEKNSKKVAQNNLPKTEQAKDSNQSEVTSLQKNDEANTSKENTNQTITNEKTIQDNLITKKVIVGETKSGISKSDTNYFSSRLTVNNTSAPQQIKKDNVAINKEAKPDAANENNDMQAKAIDEKVALAKKQPETADKIAMTQNAKLKTNQGYIANRKADNNQIRGNIFRGRILDANNNPIPFANITITKDSIGTYSDARGNFNFISSDSVLNVQVRSVGFSNINTQLKNRVTNNEIVLQEDKSLTAKILDTSTVARNRSLETTVIVEGAEPEDGWGLYDMYIVNNLQMPDVVKEKKITGDVELSFDVDKNGVPFNIRITKSLCDACDKEAIRLLKEGPKWKRKIKKGKGTVTVSF